MILCPDPPHCFLSSWHFHDSSPVASQICVAIEDGLLKIAGYSSSPWRLLSPRCCSSSCLIYLSLSMQVQQRVRMHSLHFKEPFLRTYQISLYSFLISLFAYQTACGVSLSAGHSISSTGALSPSLSNSLIISYSGNDWFSLEFLAIALSCAFSSCSSPQHMLSARNSLPELLQQISLLQTGCLLHYYNQHL